MKEIPVLINCLDKTKWEEIPDEDLWEDGEIREGHSLAIKIYEQVVMKGNWKLIRESDFADDDGVADGLELDSETNYLNNNVDDEDDGRDREWEEIND